MKQYQFFISDRQGMLYSVYASEFVTKQRTIAMAFVLRAVHVYYACPKLYVRYPISLPGTGSVYCEYDYSTCHFVERISVRQFFPTWDIRRIRKEWRCLNG